MPAEIVSTLKLGVVRNTNVQAYCGTKTEDTKRTRLQDNSGRSNDIESLRMICEHFAPPTQTYSKRKKKAGREGPDTVKLVDTAITKNTTQFNSKKSNLPAISTPNLQS